MNETLGYVHFFVSFIGSYIIFWPMHYLGMSGVPRRYYSFKEFQAFSQYDDLNKIISMGAIMVFIAQLLFVANFVYSIYRGRKMTKDNLNPWQSNTLEWTTDVEPGHGNWKGAIPTVYRWAYDLSLIHI